MFSILRNAYLHRVRDDQRQRCVSIDGVSELPQPSPDALPEIEPEQLQKALNELPEVFRSAVILYYFEGFSYRDIAEQMDLPLGTVMSRLARAKAHLRNLLIGPDGNGRGDSQRREKDAL